MRRSDVFESFVKIALEKGLISEGEHAEQTEKSLENPRWDSRSPEQIAELYYNKPPAPSEMEYKRNIIEVAHPESLVISPSYDKLHGLVENENERQDITLNIIMKDPYGGHVNQKKYAQKELMMSLVRIANDLDNRDQEELRVLADTCLFQASEQPQLEKRAWVWFVVIGVAAILGAVYAKNHLPFHSDGWDKDYQKLLGEIDDLLTSNTNWGVGYEYRPEFIQMVNDLKEKMGQMDSAVKKIMPLLDKLEKPRTGPELVEMAKQPETQELIKGYKEFQAQLKVLLPYIAKIEQDFSNESFKQRQIKDKGIFTSMVDSVGFLHGGAGLVADDFDDVVHALQAVMKDIKGLADTMRTADSLEQQAKQQLASAQTQMGEIAPDKQAPTASGTTPPGTPPPQGAPEEKGKAPWDNIKVPGNLSEILGG